MTLIYITVLVTFPALLAFGLLRPKQLLVFAVVMTVFFPQGAVERDFILESIIGGIFVAALLGFLGNMVFRRLRGKIPPGIDRRLYFLFLVALLINMGISLHRDVDLTFYTTRILGFWIFILFVKIFYVLITSDTESMSRIYKAFALAGFINVALIMIATVDNPDRATTLLGQSLMLPLPIIAGGIAYYKFLKARRISLIWVGVFSLVLLGVLMTGSRGLALALAATILIITMARRHLLDGAKLIVLIPMLAVAAWAGSGFFERVLSDGAQDTASVRYDEIGVAWNAFRSSPLFGNGIGYKYISDSLELRLLEGTDYIHNMMFFIFTSFGLSGLAIFGAYALYSLRLVMKDQWQGDLVLMVGASGVGVLIYSFTQAIFFTVAYNLFMAFVMAVGIAARQAKALNNPTLARASA